MNKYNAEHYRDETAAIAISRADKARRRLKKEPIRRLAGLTYKIGEVCGGSYRIGDIYRFEWENGVLEIWQVIKAEGR